MGMRTFIFLVVWLILLATAFAGGYYVRHHFADASNMVAGPLGPFRPRPRPDPEPPPAPLEESDARLFQRLRLHIEKAADERAAKQIEAAFDDATRRLESTNPDGSLVVGAEPSQFAFTSLFASALVGFIWKAVKIIVLAVVGSAIIALLVKFWAILVPAFMLAVTIVSWPVAFAAAKLAQPSKEKQ